MQALPPRVTLVFGGARSGKSRIAETLLAATAPPWTYIATAQPLDDEMRARIDEHRVRRGAAWRTVETPILVPEALQTASGSPALVDCLTLWLSNMMLDDLNIAARTARLLHALAGRAAPTVLVSNEVGLGIVPDNALARRFRDAAGLLNQAVAAQADSVVFMTAGLPIKVK